jgi:transcriptional regulator with XRE-family HTH domain
MKLNVELINKMIEKQGISFTSFAKRIGMTHTGLKSALANESMSLKNLIKVCEYFDKPIEYFFTKNSDSPFIEKAEVSLKDVTSEQIQYRLELMTVIKELVSENRKMFDYIMQIENEKNELFIKLENSLREQKVI